MLYTTQTCHTVTLVRMGISTAPQMIRLILKSLCRSAVLPGTTQQERDAMAAADQKTVLKRLSFKPKYPKLHHLAAISISSEILWFHWNTDLEEFSLNGVKKSLKSKASLSLFAAPLASQTLLPSQAFLCSLLKGLGVDSSWQLLPTPLPSEGLTHRLGFFVIPHLFQKRAAWPHLVWRGHSCCHSASLSP